MPRYFLDTDDGDIHARDSVGIELDAPEAARQAVLDVLPDMAREKMPDGDHRTFFAKVRDESGTAIYSATLTLFGQWIEQDTSGLVTVVAKDFESPAIRPSYVFGKGAQSTALDQTINALIDATDHSSDLSDRRIHQVIKIALFQVGRLLGEDP